MKSWSVNIDNGLVNGVVFIDLKKAFDTIDHNILRKLRVYDDEGQAVFAQDEGNRRYNESMLQATVSS